MFSEAHDIDRTYGSDKDAPQHYGQDAEARYSTGEEGDESLSERLQHAQGDVDLVAALDPQLLSTAAAGTQAEQELRERSGSSSSCQSHQSVDMPRSQFGLQGSGGSRSHSDSVILPESDPVASRETLDRDDVEAQAARRHLLTKQNFKKGMAWPIPCIGLPLIPVLVVLVVLVLVGLTFRKYAETASLLELKLWEWCVLIGLTLLTLMAALLAVNIVMFFIRRFLLQSSIYYYANGITPPSMISLWAIIMLIVGNVVLDTWGESDTFMWFVQQFFVSLLVVGLCYVFRVIGEKTLLRRVANKQYFVKIRTALYREQVVQRILRAKKKFDEHRRHSTRSHSSFLSSRSRSRMTVVEPREGVPTPSQLDHMVGTSLPDEESVGSSTRSFVLPTHVMKSLTKIGATNVPEFDAKVTLSKKEREQRAIQLAEKVFGFLHSQGASRTQPLTKESFLRPSDFVVVYASRSERRKAYEMFALESANGLVTLSVVESVLIDIYNERKTLAKGLQDRNDIAAVLSGLVGIFFWVIMVVIVLLLFGADVNTVILPFASLLLGFSFAFGPTLRSVLEAGILILFVHPFDVGDRIYVGGLGGPALFVTKMRLFRTTCRMADNRWVAVPNTQLVSNPIYNYARSGTVSLDISLEVSFDTPWEDLMQLRERLLTYVQMNKETFDKDMMFNINSASEQNKLNVSIWLTLKYVPWAKVPDWLTVRTQVFSVIQAASEELNITYTLPPQRFLGKDVKFD
jgi:small-conductance mechanosensitive channel